MKKYSLLIVLIIIGCRVSAQSSDTTFRSPEKELATFYKIVTTADMDGVFNGTPVTILAPDNKAFKKLPQLDSLIQSQNKTVLAGLLNNHIITGKFTIKDITALIHQNNGSAVLTSLSGRKYTFRINANRNLVFTDESGAEHIIEVFDIHNGSASIFIIASVIATKE